MEKFNKILILQTAFIGDVILATGLIESLAAKYPTAKIDFLLRKGNENLLLGHPKLNKTLVWDKKGGKYKNLFKILKEVRKNKYDLLVNVQRFASSGIFTALSKATVTIGYANNPMSFAFTHKVKHEIGELHEIERNHLLIKQYTGEEIGIPKLYPSDSEYANVAAYKKLPYVCMAPSSVWFTKALPEAKWIELINKTKEKVYLLGAPNDLEYCNTIISKCAHKNIENLCGKVNLLESAALMQGATMNFVNDSAPLHLCTAMAAPVTAFFCSTVPSFGFGPYLENGTIKETELVLECRPCGLHGRKSCPLGHFNCAHSIEV